MKRYIYICFLLLMVALYGCQESQWMDWKTQNELWLEENAKKDGVVVTTSGLQYKIIADPNPTDARPQIDSYVYVTYVGTLINGHQFDSNSRAGMSMSSVVEGFAEGLRKIHVHGDIEIYIPWQLGYVDDKDHETSVSIGTEGTSSYIPEYSTLIFNVHLDAVN